MDLQEFKRPYKLIALDVDMTLTNHDREVHPEDKAILEKLHAQGVHIVLASGRMTHSILKFAREKLGFETDVSAYNGAMVWVRGNDKPIFHDPIPPEVALDIVEEAEKLQQNGTELSVNCYLDDQLYSQEQTRLTDIYSGRTKSVYNFTGRPVSELLRQRNFPSTKLIILGDPDVNQKLYPQFQSKFGGKTEVLITDPEYLEFMNCGVDKGKAILALMRHYHIDDGLALVFGDGNNDVPMLKLDNVVSFAMNNAADEVKSAANAVAPDSYGGIAACLKQIM